jgi:hypothetical protein
MAVVQGRCSCQGVVHGVAASLAQTSGLTLGFEEAEDIVLTN